MLNGIELEIICLDQEDEQKMKVDQLVGADFLVWQDSSDNYSGAKFH